MSRKNWYNIKITPIEINRDPYTFMIETYNLKSTMDKYIRDKEDIVIASWEIIK